MSRGYDSDSASQMGPPLRFSLLGSIQKVSCQVSTVFGGLVGCGEQDVCFVQPLGTFSETALVKRADPSQIICSVGFLFRGCHGMAGKGCAASPFGLPPILPAWRRPV